MKELLDSVGMCNDIDVLKNVISIMSEYCYDVPCDRRKIDMIKSVKSELGVTNYDDELMRMHLALIGELKEADYAKDDSAWRKILEYFKNATQIVMGRGMP